MKVHHLNCGTMRPPMPGGHFVAHVLLVEAPGGLVLVDSGIGLASGRDRAASFGPSRHLIRPTWDESEAAIRQVAALGFDPYDVRDIVLTHFDMDHVGGIRDFPWARVHCTAAEIAAARRPRGMFEKGRYLRAHLEGAPDLVLHAPVAGESWRGFAAATPLDEIADGIALVHLPGHSRGHSAVAVDAGDYWVLHAGDAFFKRGQLDGEGGVPPAIRAMEAMMAHDRRLVRENHERLSELWLSGDPGVQLVNAHDAELLALARARA